MQTNNARPQVSSNDVITRESMIVDDIKHNICEYLDGIKTGWSFATFGVFLEAPLPDLYLNGYGSVPLPVAKRDIYTICKTETEGDDGITPQVVKSVHRETGKYLYNQWEMKSDSVSMHNPAWNGFVQKMAVKAARDLGIEPDAGAVKAKLARAHLWAAKARMSSHQGIPNMTDCFGKLLVSLPASRSGGHLLLKYGWETKEFATEHSGCWGYSYVAYYTDVALELKPLISGHMLMLEYDLILPSPAKLPSLADLYGEKGKLRELLVTWNDAVTKEREPEDDSFPTLLAHQCDGIYDESLGLDELKGNDRLRAAYLRHLCSQLDIGLYIADMNRTLTGFSDYHGDDDDDYWIDVEVEDSIILTKVVDPEGNTVGGDIAIDVEENFVESDPFDAAPDTQDIDRNHGLVTCYYRRTLLVMIPSVAKAEWLPDECPEIRPNKRKRSVEIIDLE